MRIVPLYAATPASRTKPVEETARGLAEIPFDEDSAPLIIPELSDPEIIEEPATTEELMTADRATIRSGSETAFDLPNHLSAALEELTEFAPRTAVSEYQLETRQSGARMWIALFVVTAITSFVAGSFFARAPGSSKANSTSATNENSPENPLAPAINNEVGPVQSISGTITFADGSGASKPDSEALILLLPTANASGLKLDARPLRDLRKSTSKEAVEAALRVLGATITRAADDGTFSIERRHSGAVKLIVVSRHSSRPASEAVPPPVATSLAEWFESPSHLTGRLSVQEEVLPAAKEGASGPPVEIAFGK